MLELLEVLEVATVEASLGCIALYGVVFTIRCKWHKFYVASLPFELYCLVIRICWYALTERDGRRE